MIKEKILKSLIDQINAEYYSAYLYLVLSSNADKLGYKGVANWLFIQAKEELSHGTHIFEHILERGEHPEFHPIALPEANFASIEQIFTKVLAHEQYVTGLINNIASLAMKENDHATYNFIMWYVNEQIEEESTASDLLTKIKLFGANDTMLYSLDMELAARNFKAPFASPAE